MTTKMNGTGFMRLIKAAKCSFNAAKYCLKSEAAFRQELLLLIILFPVSIYISNSMMEIALLNAVVLLLLLTEAVNTALEVICDRITTEHDKAIGLAKDLGSLAVLIATLIVAIVWFSYLYKFFTN